MQDIIIVGSGFSGSILARQIAEELDKKVLVIEKRNHIGGNAYDELNEHGILIQKYGPHFLNTDNYSIIKFIKKYGELFPHDAKLLSFLDGKYIQLPFNFKSMKQLVSEEKSASLLGKLRKSFSGRDRVPVLELVDYEDDEISWYGNLLFDKAFKTYTSKMWGIGVEEIDKYVLERVPMAMGYDERYLNKDFQYLPIKGFTKIFENMLNHPNIEVKLNTDAMEYITFNEKNRKITFDGNEVKCLIFTGPIDELFSLKYGALPYRSLDIRYKYSSNKSVLPSEIVSYPQAEGYVRSTEYRKMMYDCSEADGSVVATEYPLQYDINSKIANIPYYPVNTFESDALYKKYVDEVNKYDNIFLCGRLAEFKYYNMDICIEHALEYYKFVKEYLQKNG